jgi:myo-inositol 2-dehydrogenase/D-chiro-inositol 1-dehydrogenase
MGDYTPTTILSPGLVPAVNKQQDIMRKLKVGVVGIGRMGRKHAINILQHVPKATLLCVCSPTESDLIWAAEHLAPQGVRVVPTFEEMVETPGLEAVIIASATPSHGEQSMAALKRGIHVLCEKPLCKDYDEVNQCPLFLGPTANSYG